MNQHLNSRRSFIASMAILSAGAALQPPGSLLGNSGTNNLKQQWKQFCKNNNGIAGVAQPLNPSMIPLCAGHFYKLGEAVYFACEGIMAQPTWVYWGEQKNNPHDLIISFYDEKNKTSFFRINRFELEGLNALRRENNLLNTLNVLKEMAHTATGQKIDKTLLKVTTIVNRKQHAKSVAILSTHQIVFQNQLIYNA
jgi:hypothetical protein